MVKRLLALLLLAPVVAWAQSTCGVGGQCDVAASEDGTSLLQGRRMIDGKVSAKGPKERQARKKRRKEKRAKRKEKRAKRKEERKEKRKEKREERRKRWAAFKEKFKATFKGPFRKWMERTAKSFKKSRKKLKRVDEEKNKLDETLSQFPLAFSQAKNAIPIKVLSKSDARALEKLEEAFDKVMEASSEYDQVRGEFIAVTDMWNDVCSTLNSSNYSLIQARPLRGTVKFGKYLVKQAEVKQRVRHGKSTLLNAKLVISNAQDLLDGLTSKLQAKGSMGNFDYDFTSRPQMNKLQDLVGNMKVSLSEIIRRFGNCFDVSTALGRED